MGGAEGRADGRAVCTLRLCSSERRERAMERENEDEGRGGEERVQA